MVELDDEDEDAFVPKAAAKPQKKNRKSADENHPSEHVEEKTPKKKLKTKDVDPSEKKRRVENYQTFMNRGGPDAPGSKTIPDGAPNCLKNLTFVMSGVLESLDRDECKSLIEKYGGRVTGSISRKTSYLLSGRDGGEAKLEKARDLKVKIISEDDLLQLIASRPGDDETPKKISAPASKKPPPPPPSPVKVKPTTVHSNSNVEKAKVSLSSPTSEKPPIDESILMCKCFWESNELLDIAPSIGADKYKPRTLKSLIGQQGEKSCVQKLTVWLRDWYQHHGRSDEKVKAKPSTAFNRHEDPAMFKAALLSGPPGIGQCDLSRRLSVDIAVLF